jgi:hypothetical protein
MKSRKIYYQVKRDIIVRLYQEDLYHNLDYSDVYYRKGDIIDVNWYDYVGPYIIKDGVEMAIDVILDYYHHIDTRFESYHMYLGSCVSAGYITDVTNIINRDIKISQVLSNGI